MASQGPLLLTIRFTASIPDLDLDIAAPSTTTGIALKVLIRSHLPLNYSTCRLRLIQAGKIFKDTLLLSTTVKQPAPPPPSTKGKEPELLPQRIYIQCAVGDVLSPTELAAEAAAAVAYAPDLSAPSASSQAARTVTPSPRGFDRLQSAGLTAPEISSLRLQFRSNQRGIHTPASMPSSPTLLLMEDAWIDSNAAPAGPGGQLDFGGDELAEGALDDFLWGNVMGFLWPLGAVTWLVAGGEVLSQRRKIAVFTGVLMSFMLGVFKMLS